MKRTTKKLSGIGLEVFLRRFYASYSGIDDRLARQLSADGAKTFASVRVRRIAWRDWRSSPAGGRQIAKPSISSADSAPATNASVPEATKPEPVADKAKTAPSPPVGESASEVSPPPTPVAVATETTAPFDPYSIGLVPTFQREGADGLAAKLAAISSLDNLRKMARSQQIALPAELRGPDAPIDTVRDAIVTAVGKRIADRRAAAG